jgi:hypothetical protein
MRIGIDFDNTIVCYDELFHRVALERGLIPASLPVNKGCVRDYLRETGREDVWTAMQGDVYGARMLEATAFPGACEFFTRAARENLDICIVSHKTRHPYLGPKYDLHQAATAWLERQGFFDANQIGLDRGRVFFELTKQGKLERIAATGCTHFVDDLPELLAEPAFPRGVARVLFDPTGTAEADPEVYRVRSWKEIEEKLLAA